MKRSARTLATFVGILFSLHAYAGTDPIGWSVSPSGFPATTTIGSTYAVTYTMTNNLPFAVPLSIDTNYVGGSFTLDNGCNKTLAAKGSAGSSCLVHLLLQPLKVGQSTAQVILAYHNNRVPLPKLLSTAVSGETVDRINGFITNPLPAVTYTGTNYPFTFTFYNNGPSSVTATAVNLSGFSATTNTCTSALAANASCVVTGTFSPVATGSATLNATYVYSSNGSSKSVPLSTQTNVHTSSGGCHHVSGFVALPLPVSTLIYSDHVVKYTFTNNCNSSTETLGNINFTSDIPVSPPTLTKGTDTCSGATLAAGGNCSIYLSVIPNAIATGSSDMSVTASIPYNNSTLVAHSTTSTDVNRITNQSSLHTVMFVNQCSQGVWYAFQNGAGGNKSPDPTPSASRTWAGYQLNQQITGAAPQVITLQFSQYNGGSIVGRTGCDTNPASPTYGVCNTGNCTSLGNSTGTCTVSSAPTSPATIYEQTMNSTAGTDGVYDMSLINGFNIPGEYRSLAPMVTPLNFNNACGQSAGAIIQPAASGLTICPWTFTPPSTGTDCTAGTQTDDPANYYYVTAGADDACTPGSCSGGQVCGMAWTPQPSSNPQYLGTPVTRRCGTFQGYWTVTDWINYSATTGVWGSCNLYAHYSMGTTLDSIKPVSQPTYGTFGGLTATLSNLYGCQITSNDSLDSGYDAGKINACGCKDWNNPSDYIAPQLANCQSFNPLWSTYVLDRIKWLKQACPNAYSYQFDDKSSSFTCNVPDQQTAYEVTFCPGGKTGAPA